MTSAGLNAAGIRADELRERSILAGLTSPSFVILGLLLFIPVGWLFWLSFIEQDVFTLENYARMVTEPAYRSIFMTTFQLSVLVTVLSVLLGYPVAYMIAMLPPRAASICLTLVLIPFWTALLVRTYAWLVILQRRGIVNTLLTDWGIIDEPLQLVHNFTGTVIGMLHIMIPFLVLPLYANMRAIDRDYSRAAASLGASPITSFWKVYLPLSIPGLAAGTVMVFIICLGFYITPQFLGGGRVTTLSMKIQQNVATYFNWGAASSLGVVLFVVTILIFWGFSRLFPLRRLTEVFVPARARLWLYTLSGLVIAFLVVPVLIVIPLSFSSSTLLEFPPRAYSLRWYTALFGSIEWRDAAWMSLKVAVLTTIVATPVGTAAAYGLHLGGFRATGILRMLILAPLLVPVILTAVGIFYVYALLGLNNTLIGLVLAHTMLALPFVVVSISAGLRSYDMAQERVARSLGAPWLRAFWSITLPRRMFNALRDQIEPTIAAISTILVVLSVATVAALEMTRRPVRRD